MKLGTLKNLGHRDEGGDIHRVHSREDFTAGGQTVEGILAGILLCKTFRNSGGHVASKNPLRLISLLFQKEMI